jgi:trimethylamine:corrinoid methyltransferase-like protein
MTDRNGTILGVEDKNKIIDCAKDVLRQIGIECSHKKTLERLSAIDGISYSGGRLHFSRDLISSHIEKKRSEQSPDDDSFKLLGPWCSFEYCDPVTNELRRPTTNDVIGSAKLIDSITEGAGAFGGPVPLYLPGVPPRLETFRQEAAAVTYTKKLGGKLTALDRTEIGFISELYKAAGRRYTLALQGLISPLRLNPEIMDTFYEQDCNPDIDIEISCAIPMAGATAPVVFPANLIQSVAETLAVDYIFNTITQSRRFDCLTVRLEPFDMKTTNIVFGSPEWCVLNRACVELENGLRGCPRRYGIFRSNSKRLDAQSMCERSMSVLYQALNGIRSFGAVGQLCVDEVFSPLQAIIDVQILKYVKRVVGGFNGCWDDSVDYIGLLQEGIADGMFIGHETTVMNFRKFYSLDTLFRYGKLNAWRTEGMKSLEDDAREEWRKLVTDYEPILDTNSLEKVQKITLEAEKYLIGFTE